jgi:hypothetical protein
VSEQRDLRAFWRVRAMHRPWTLRPRLEYVKLNLTRAALLSLNENVVPTGAFAREMVASLLRSRQTE